jgi:YVTN family beta-propeller protein
MFRRVIILLFACMAWGVSVEGGDAQTARSAYSRTSMHQGTRVELQVDHVDPGRERSAPFQAGENVRIRFKFTETSTGTPIRGASPAAWLDPSGLNRSTTSEECVGKVKRLAEGSTFSAAEVDMNGNYVATMNADPTITVVDPRFTFGDARLVALVPLKAAGEDWVASADAGRLYVSMPSAGAVAVIDMNSWEVIANLSVPGHSGRISLQPDEQYLWVAYVDDRGSSGVVAFTTRELKLVARIPTGQGYHQIEFSDDSAFAFVTNPGSGSVSVIDVRKLTKIKDVATGGSPGWIAWSELAKAAYVSSESDGEILAIGGAGHNLLGRMSADSGVAQIRFASGGRFALAVNPKNDRIYVIDASLNRIVQTGKLAHGPDQITFSNKMAYIRHRGSDSILMIPLESLGMENKPVQTGEFTGGDHPAGAMSVSTPADSVVHVLDEAGVLVANPGDHAVYIYMEGMAAPSGSFSTFGREPRAVLQIERSLRERAPGTYETVVKLIDAGKYDLAMLLDRPQFVSCFDFSVGEDPRRAALLRPRLRIQPLLDRGPSAPRRAGKPATLLFRLVDAENGKVNAGLQDVTALIFMAGGWQRRQSLISIGEGVYSLQFQPPTAGHYEIYLSVPSLGMDYARYVAVDFTAESKNE